MENRLVFEQIRDALIDSARVLRENKQRYNDLDSQIGDSDHGDSIDFTFKKVEEIVADYDADKRDIGDLLKTVGRSIVLSAGAAMGPLYGTAFVEAGKATLGLEEVDYAEFVSMWRAFVIGIETRGGVKCGEKTMFDAISPAIEALEQAHLAGQSLSDALQSAVIAAEDGMNSTKEMKSLRGRSSRLGERSIGYIDPGSASMYTFISTFFGALQT